MILAHPFNSIKISNHFTLKFELELENSLSYKYSNGAIEGSNNLIKVIKRIVFTYCSYGNFKTRILLITNTMARVVHK